MQIGFQDRAGSGQDAGRKKVICIYNVENTKILKSNIIMIFYIDIVTLQCYY